MQKHTGLEYLNRNEISGMTCDMDKPFAFISYRHSEHDAQIVMNVFKKLYTEGYNLWIDTANIPRNEEHWGKAAQNAITNKDGNCKLAIFFRSESSCVSINIKKELRILKNTASKPPIIVVDIWEDPKMTASDYLDKLIADGRDEEYRIYDDICDKYISEDANAIRLGADAHNNIDDLVEDLKEAFVIDIMREKAEETPVKEAPASEKAEEPSEPQYYLYKPKDAKAIILEENGRYIIKKYSRWASKVPAHASSSLRKALKNDGTVKNNVFQRDYEVSAPSAAAVLINGGSVSGTTVFVDKNKITREEAEKFLSAKEERVSKAVVKPEEKAAPVKDTGEYYKCKAKDGLGVIAKADGKFIIKKNSRWVSEPSPKADLKLRDRLINDGTVVNNVFQRDYEASSSSSAANLICGRSISGNSVIIEQNRLTSAEAEVLFGEVKPEIPCGKKETFVKDPVDTKYYDYMVKDGHGIIAQTNGTYIIKKHSIWASTVTNDIVAALRDKLVNTGIVKDNVFLEDYDASSPSTAAKLICGYSINGKAVLVDKIVITREEAEKYFENPSLITTSPVTSKPKPAPKKKTTKRGVGEIL